MKRRERIVINRPFQWRVVGLVAGSMLSALLLFGAFAWFQYRVLRRALTEYPELLESLNGQTLYYGSVIGSAFLLLLALSVLLSIRITHRVVGPVNRLRDELELMRKKDSVSVLAVRDDDELDDLVKAINRLILHLREGDENGPERG